MLDYNLDEKIPERIDPEIVEYCDKHGYPLEPEKIRSLKHLRLGFIILSALSMILSGVAILTSAVFGIDNTHLVLFTLLTAIMSISFTSYLNRYSEILDYSKLEKVLKLIERCSIENSVTIESVEYHLPCGLIKYIKYCLRTQEKALKQDITKWNFLIKYYDNKTRSDLLRQGYRKGES